MDELYDAIAPFRFRVFLVTDADLERHEFINDAKRFCRTAKPPRRQLMDWVIDGVRDSNALLVDQSGKPVEIDYGRVLDIPNFDLWYRDWVRNPAAAHVPPVHPASRERVRFLITALRMMFPKESTVWGRPIPQVERLCAA